MASVVQHLPLVTLYKENYTKNIITKLYDGCFMAFIELSTRPTNLYHDHHQLCLYAIEDHRPFLISGHILEVLSNSCLAPGHSRPLVIADPWS